MTTVLVCEVSEIGAAGIEAVLKLAACEGVRHCRSGDEMLHIAGLLRPEIIIASTRTLGDEAIVRWSRFTGQFGGKAKMDFKFDYAASFSSFSCVA
jgi:hypothetical protein